MPSLYGAGPAQRAFHTLRILSEAFEVHLLVVGIKDRGRKKPAPPEAAKERVKVIPVDPWRDLVFLGRRTLQIAAPLWSERWLPIPSEWCCASRRVVAATAEQYRGVSFDTIHVFRLCMEPFAAPYRAANPGSQMQLDLDEIESLTRRRLARLYGLNGQTRKARRWEVDARVCERAERDVLPAYDRVLVSSERERLGLCEMFQNLEVTVVPNVVAVPPAPHRARNGGGPFVILFLGHLAYYPNADAVAWFAQRVLGLVRRKADRDVRFDVAGPGASRGQISRWKRVEGLRVVGPVERVDECYDSADAVVVPIRAGGGTRIKILEAFARQTPVVTTSVGMEGIDVTAGEHLLVGDTPEDHARACLELIADPDLAHRLTDHAFAVWKRSYQPHAMRAGLLGAGRT